jgi:tetratricopeptide (TPR) repeat protein
MRCRELIAVAVMLGAGRALGDGAGPPTQPPPEVDLVDHHLAERLTRLAEHYYRAGEYYRAISAYEELALFSGDDAARLSAAIRIAMSYHHGHQLEDALAGYRAALTLARDGDVAQALRIQLALARVERSFDEPGTEAFDVIAAELAPSTASGRYRALALVQLARIEGLAGRRGAAREAYGALQAACLPASLAASSAASSPTPLAVPSPECSLEPALLRALERPAPTRRSPGLGVALSLIVPGAGSVYGGHLIDGLYYFALTALSGLGALDVYTTGRSWTDQKVTFYGLTALATLFYSASAVQGYVSVARHNAVIDLEARRALWRDTEAALPLESIISSPGSSPGPGPAPAQ